jgi:hypothetical protein
MRFNLLAFVSAILAMALSDRASGQGISRSTQLSSFHCTYEELSSLVRRIGQFSQKADAGTNARITESLTLESDTVTVTLSGGFSSLTSAGAPKVSSSVHYRWTAYGDNLPISEVDIYLTSWRQVLKISGSAQDQVEALESVVGNVLRSKSVWYAGPLAQLFGFALALGTASLLFISGLATRQRGLQRILITFAITVLIALWVLPWSSWLANTQVSSEPVFYEKNTSLISFLGLLATVGTVIWSISKWGKGFIEKLVETNKQDDPVTSPAPAISPSLQPNKPIPNPVNEQPTPSPKKSARAKRNSS